MRLALYSDQESAANAPLDERVLRLIGARRARIGYVASAPDPRRSDFERKRRYYEHLEADLVLCVDPDTATLAQDLAALSACDAIHLAGGNTFEFLRWLKRRGVLPMLHTYAAEDRGVLIGASAGAILMTPSVRSALLCGDLRPPGPIDDAALGLVSLHVWPHYVPGAGSASVLHACAVDLPDLYGCADGTGIVVDGARIELLGAVRLT